MTGQEDGAAKPRVASIHHPDIMSPTSQAGMGVPGLDGHGAGLPRLCLVGPMLGRHPGRVVSQGEILAEALRGEGVPVLCTSSALSRYRRPAEMLATLVARRRDYDVVGLLVFSGPSFALADLVSRVARMLRKPVVMFLHGGALPTQFARTPARCRRVLGRAAALVAPSPFLARAAGTLGFDVVVIPNIIDLTRYSHRWRDRPEPRLLWMRAFDPIYNPELAIHVLERVRRIVPDATLVMAGQDNGLEREMHELASRLGLAGAVTFPGYLDMESKLRAMDWADIFLNTNRVDNMPVSVVEACAKGMAVVATAVGGLPDLITNGVDGLLVPSDDADAMAAAVLRVLREPDLSGRLSMGGRVLAEWSSWERVFPQFADIFRRAADIRP
jgi:glycosyltransferase involved in cell wall biosynthesis